MSVTRRVFFSLLHCGALLLIFTACIRTTAADEQAIRNLLAERRQALTTRDHPRYHALLSRSYHDKGQDQGAKTAELASTLANWDAIDYQADPPRITISGKTASATSRYRLRVTKQGKTFLLEGEETLQLRQEQGGWKITGGL